MATHSATVAPRHVLIDLIPTTKVNAWARDLALVVTGAVGTAASAQVAITIPAISPVPFVLTTLTVLLLSATYGPARAAASMSLYLAAGIAGVPWFSDASGATLGYVGGFILASIVVGHLARRGGDRTVSRTVGIMVIGNLAIYAVGVPYLMAVSQLNLTDGLLQGAAPFLVADLIKLVVAAAVLPGVWAAVKRLRK